MYTFSTMTILLIAVCTCCVFGLFSLFMSKYAPKVHEKLSNYYLWILWGLGFIILFLISGIKFHNWFPGVLETLCESAFIAIFTVAVGPMLIKKEEPVIKEEEKKEENKN